MRVDATPITSVIHVECRRAVSRVLHTAHGCDGRCHPVAVTVLVGVQHWSVEEGISLCRLGQLEDKVSGRTMGVPTIMMVRYCCHPCRGHRTRRCSTFVGQRRDQLVSFKSARRQGEREDDGRTDDHDGEASLPSLSQSPYSSVFNVRWSKKRPACVV